MSLVVEHAAVTVTYSRTIPTKPYGNDKVEFFVTAGCPDEVDFKDFCDFIRRELLTLTDKAEFELRGGI